MNWAELNKLVIENMRTISIIVGGVVLALALGAGILEYKSHKERKGVAALYEARQEVEKVKDMPLEQKIEVLNGVVEGHGGTRAAFEALLAMGDLHMEAKAFEEGVAAYSRAVEAATDSFAKTLALYNKATGEEIAGKYEDAIRSYAVVLTEPSAEFLKPEIVMAQARCNEKAGNKEEAIAQYQKVQDEFPKKAYYANSAAVFQKRLQKQQNN